MTEDITKVIKKATPRKLIQLVISSTVTSYLEGRDLLKDNEKDEIGERAFKEGFREELMTARDKAKDMAIVVLIHERDTYKLLYTLDWLRTQGVGIAKEDDTKGEYVPSILLSGLKQRFSGYKQSSLILLSAYTDKYKFISHELEEELYSRIAEVYRGMLLTYLTLSKNLEEQKEPTGDGLARPLLEAFTKAIGESLGIDYGYSPKLLTFVSDSMQAFFSDSKKQGKDLVERGYLLMGLSQEVRVSLEQAIDNFRGMFK